MHNSQSINIEVLKNKIKRLERTLIAYDNKLIVSTNPNNLINQNRNLITEELLRLKTNLENQPKKRVEVELNDETLISEEKHRPRLVEIQGKIVKSYKELRDLQLGVNQNGNKKLLNAKIKLLKIHIKSLLERESISKKFEKQLKGDFATTTKSKTTPTKPERRKKTKKITTNHESKRAVDDHVYTYRVLWKDVYFEQKRIKLLINNYKVLYYPYLLSRNSYEYIKAILIHRKIDPLFVKANSVKIFSIDNIGVLDDVIMLLEIQTEWSNIFIDNKKPNATSILRTLNKLSKTSFNLFFKNKDQTPYLNALCSYQALGDHIVPVLEEVNSQALFTKGKESFLFTIVNNECTYIIWESVEKDKATFIFQTNKLNYLLDLQRIFDYISTTVQYKRTNLRKGASNEEATIKAFCTLYHTTFEKWVSKLRENCLSNINQYQLNFD